MAGKLRRMWAFVQKDLHESIKNRSIFIAVILPLVASLLFGFLDTSQTPKNFQLGVYDQTNSHFPSFLKETALNFQVQPVLSLEQGKELVNKGKLDGFIVVEADDYFQVYLDSGRPVYFFALRENLTQLIEVYLQTPPRYELDIIPLGESSVSRSVLPVWITITMSMIGIMVVSGMFAEEKDNKTIEAIGVSPVGYGELLLGKGVFGVLLSFGTVLIMLVLNRVFNLGIAGWLGLISLVLSGSLCFTALGLLIGVLAGSQSSARSIATMIYFPFLFPTLIADLSSFTQTLASFFPTFYLFRGLEAILLHEQGFVGVTLELAILIIFALALLATTHWAYERMVNVLD